MCHGAGLIIQIEKKWIALSSKLLVNVISKYHSIIPKYQMTLRISQEMVYNGMEAAMTLAPFN